MTYITQTVKLIFKADKIIKHFSVYKIDKQILSKTKRKTLKRKTWKNTKIFLKKEKKMAKKARVITL